jgi:cytochrome oxidase Cu insertion factor (SCO1/SenC/PrrC family)
MLRQDLFRVACVLLLAFAASSAVAADFGLTDSDGKVHRLVDYRGKWVIVNFWAT